MQNESIPNPCVRKAFPSPEQFLKFWKKVDKRGPDECWPCGGTTTSGGYGKFNFRYNGRIVHSVAHRIAWMSVNGPIQGGLLVLHECDNPPCCNPKHLFDGTHADNGADMVFKGRQACGAKNGKYTKPEMTPRGENHGLTVLTNDMVSEMRKLYASGQSSYGRLIRLFGVSKSTVHRIITRQYWRHIK